MNTRLIIDEAGRVVIPKPLREEWHLEAGDALELESAGEQITLRPVRGTAPLRKEHGVWVVYSGEPLPGSATNECCRKSARNATRQTSAGANEGAEVYSTLTRVPDKFASSAAGHARALRPQGASRNNL